MTWLFAFVVVAVLGVVAVYGAGKLGNDGDIRETYDDRPDVRVPADRPLNADDLRRLRFTTAFRGYRMSEVDSLLERLIRESRDREG